MASNCNFTDFISKEEEDFDRMLKQIGGKGNIYLVGAADGENNCSLFQEFIMDMFHADVHVKRDKNANLGNGDIKSAAARNSPVSSDEAPGKGDNTVDVDEKQNRHKRKISGHNRRAISCAVVIFIFRHGYIQNKVNYE